MPARTATRPGGANGWPTDWSTDDHDAALTAYLLSAGPTSPRPDGASARRFFEDAFDWSEVAAAHYTGYFEPVVPAATARSAAFPVPLHGSPPGGIAASRAEIEDGDLLRGHEIAWLRDAVDRFMLQVQGSGRLALADGGTMRVGYAGRNGRPYISIGRHLIATGAIPAAEMTADVLAAWLRADAARGAATMRLNESYVLFRRLDAAVGEGPPGTMGCPVTAGRTLAVDPGHVPLGSPVWIEVASPDPIARLCVAQDTGSAIKGAGRADLFFGSGRAAGQAAGALNHGGRMVVLTPR